MGAKLNKSEPGGTEFLRLEFGNHEFWVQNLTDPSFQDRDLDPNVLGPELAYGLNVEASISVPGVHCIKDT